MMTLSEWTSIDAKIISDARSALRLTMSINELVSEYTRYRYHALGLRSTYMRPPLDYDIMPPDPAAMSKAEYMIAWEHWVAAGFHRIYFDMCTAISCNKAVVNNGHSSQNI